MSDDEAAIARRARIHAALGDETRLAIVEHLVVADASPSELSARHALPTNLLAHHLRVLEQAGVVRRVRSEGDRRRSYVQLRAADPDVATIAGAGVTPSRAVRVVFVCTHNSARSQLAAALWRSRNHVPATSAGTHPARQVHPRAIAVGRRHGLTLQPASTAHVSDVLRPDDLVIAVCDNAHEELAASLDRWHWSVPDPARRDSAAAFAEAYDTLSTRIDQVAELIRSA